MILMRGCYTNELYMMITPVTTPGNKEDDKMEKKRPIPNNTTQNKK
jgi:hypothetical protein